MEHIFFPVAFSFLSGFIIAYNIFHKKSVSRSEIIAEKAKIQLQREEQIKFDEEQKALLKEEKELNKGFTNN